jgi:exodeoxyribonuclease VII large subunit
MKSITLFELNGLVKSTLQYEMSTAYWVQAEISSLSVAYNGHCYLELVQKSPSGTGFIAKAKANIWNSTFQRLKPFFEQETGLALAVGLNVLLQVNVSFHEVFGYSLVVSDIDPTYTMGDMARRRREILARLEAEGVLELNKELAIPAVPQRIAVVSSPTAAGYGDFCNQLNNNVYGFRFYYRLFPAVMQGDNVEQSVIEALNSIASCADLWDVVVIIRGGGAVSELSCFDSYNLAMNIANFPLPVVTGIGHERDDTVIDVVANTKVKTPTAAAELLIGLVADSASKFDSLTKRLSEAVGIRMESEKHRISLLSQKLPSLLAVLKAGQERKIGLLMEKALGGAKRMVSEQTYAGRSLQLRLSLGMQNIITGQFHRLELMEKSMHSVDPEKILRRGYSITLLEGKVVTSASIVKPGDRLQSRFADGTVESEVLNFK